MGWFDGLLGGSGSSAETDLYAGLLTPQQLAAIRQRSAGDDLLKMAGAFAQAGQASRLPTGGIGSAIGQAAASLAGSGDEGILKFLQAQKLGAEVTDKKSLAEARRAFLADLQRSGQIPPGFLGGATPGAGAAPGAAPGVAGEAPGAPTADFGGDAAAAPAEAGAMMSYLVTKHGLSPAAAAGMLGNVGVESNFRPGVVGDKGTSGGLFQHHNERWDSLKQFAQSQGKPWTDPYVQLDFAVQEAKGMMPADWFQSNSPLQAAQQFQDIFERPRDDSGRQRGSIAAGILSRFGQSPELSSTAQNVTDAQPAAGRSLDQLRGIVANLQPGGGSSGPGPAPSGGLLGAAPAAPPIPPPSGLLGTGAAAPGPGLPPGVPRFPNPRAEQGTSGSSAQAGAYSPDFFVGDSLAVQAANAYRQQGGDAQAIAKVGISPQKILDNVNQALAQNPDTFRGKNVVVTSGSNDISQLAQVEETVQRLRAAGANVTLGGVSNEHSRLSAINPGLQEIANRQGASFAPLPSTQGDRELIHAYGRQPEFLSNIRRANAARSGGEGSTPNDFGAGGDTRAAAVIPAGAGSPSAFADSGLGRGGASYLPSLGGGPLAAPMPAGPPAAAAAPPGAGPLAAPAAPPAAAAAPGPGGLLSPGAAPGSRPAQGAPALPPAPASHPEMQQYIYDIARKGALAELAGLPNAYAPMLQALQNSPQYKALVEGAMEYTKRSVGLGFIDPEARAKEQVELDFAGPKAAAIAAANQKYIQENAAYQSSLDIAKDLLTKNGVVLGPDGQVKQVKNLPEAIAAVDMIKQQQKAELDRANTLFAAGGQQRDGTGPVEPVPGYNQLIGGTEAAKLDPQVTAEARKEQYKAGQKALDDTHAAELAANRRTQLYGQMASAMQGFQPGATSEMRLSGEKYLRDLGIIKGESVPPAEVFRQAGLYLQIHAQPKGQGSVTEYERQMFANAVPNMTNSAEGLAQAIRIGQRLDDYDRTIAQIHRESVDPVTKLPNLLEAQRRIAALGPPLDAREQAALISLQSGTAAPAAPGAATPPSVPPPGAGIQTPFGNIR